MKKTLFVNAKIYPVDSEPIKNGFLLIFDNIIVSLNKMLDRLPDCDEMIDLNGSVILPCIIDVSKEDETEQLDSRANYLNVKNNLEKYKNMPEELAIRSFTQDLAKEIDLDYCIGSLAEGMDATFTILTGEVFDETTQVQAVYIDGIKCENWF